MSGHEDVREILDGRYLVSKNGDIFSLYFKNRSSFRKREFPLKMKQSIVNGYFHVVLSGKRNFLVHRLVAMAFINGFTNESMINHKDGCKTNNNVNNLELSNNSHNQLHSIHVLGKRLVHKASKEEVDKIMDMWASGIGISSIEKEVSITCGAIGLLLKHRFENGESEIYKEHYLKVVMGYAKSLRSPKRFKAREILKQIKEKKE